MKDHQVVNAVEGLKSRLVELEQQLLDMRQVLAVVLEKLPLEPEEKEKLFAVLEVEVAKIPEIRIEQAKPERSIQELLDESQEYKSAK
jgi:hypothetical protein